MRLVEAVCEVDREASVDYMARAWECRSTTWCATIGAGWSRGRD